MKRYLLNVVVPAVTALMCFVTPVMSQTIDVARVRISFGPTIQSGSGTPEGTVTATVGSLFLRTDGGVGTSTYVKQSGGGNTGWAAISPVGTGTAGSVVFVGDSGVYSQNNSKLFWDNSAFRLGIGTALPAGSVHIAPTSPGAYTPNANADDLVIESDGNPGISITSADSGLGSIVFGSPSDVFAALIRWDFTNKIFTIGPQQANAITRILYGNGAEAIRIETSGAVGLTSTVTPTVANVGADSCGTSAATIAGNHNVGEVTVGATSGTQCRLTFAVAAPVRWNCSVNNETTANLARATVVDTTHVDLLGVFVAGDVVSYQCFPR